MALSLRHLADHARVLSLAGDRQSQWDTISALLEEAFGHRLFTSLVYLEDLRLMRRLYTTDETISPLGGFKATGNGPWSRHVLDEGKLYVAHDEQDVRTVFSEADMLIERGLQSALNIPVRHQGRVIGSLNLLAGRHAYDDADLDMALVIAGVCAPVFLQERDAALAEAAKVDRAGLDSV
ncbi:GAF domain-containing protein [Bordetella genomosp. 1]|uniref:GAF domain-containing protein n=1 Tax=Bordetella genomosp. 1 TaxID=1395607 RepID=A0A261SSV3_9BORD|nr:GAF domain-containing protein [Bordetella genomosp. 1]MDQ8030548.1 GAF domain-containing protein [Bordetella sp.]OZI40458.1 GAF domain-containing protein [Bordetella genomosp. 1]OZI68651.1 GAF domain-containing protein [Bordetella genomosp. 1]